MSRPVGRQQDEAVVVALSRGQAAHHDEGEQRDEERGRRSAQLLAGHSEDEVGVGVGQHVLHRALARAAAEQPAILEGFERAVDLIGVAGGRIEEAVDAAGDVGNEEIGADQADGAGKRRALPTREIGMPAMKNWANQTTVTRRSCRNRAASSAARRRRRRAATASSMPGTSRRFCGLGEQPGGDARRRRA